MALTNTHNLLREETIYTCTNSIGATPLACVAVMPFNGYISQVQAVSHGTFVTDCSVAVKIITQVAGGTAPTAGTAVTGSPMTITAANSAAGTTAIMAPSGANFAFEGDLIAITPSGSTGTTIGCTFAVTVKRA
jgi:hypothetical protein